MSTRATYHFHPEADWRNPVTIYCHSDGYPSGAAQYFHACAMFPGDSKGGMAELFIRANPESAELTDSHEAHGDTEYRYTVRGSDLTVYTRHGEEWKAVQTSLAAFVNQELPDAERVCVVFGRLRPVAWALHEALRLCEDTADKLSKGWLGNASYGVEQAERILSMADPSGEEHADVRAAIDSGKRAVAAAWEASNAKRAADGPREQQAVAAAVEPTAPAKEACPTRFLQYYITDGVHKCRVSYSIRTDSVTIYAQDYNGSLAPMIPVDLVRNDTDTMTDYFCKDSADIPRGHSLYAAAMSRAKANLEKYSSRKRAG